MRRYGTLLVVLAALGLMVSDVIARPGGGGQPGGAQRTRMARTGGQGGVYLADYTARIPDLSPQQRTQIAAIRTATMEKIAAIQRDMNEQVKRVLNPDQAKAMEDAQRATTHRGPDGIIMTDAQKKIMDEARAEAGKVDDREARTAIMNEANEEIRKTFNDEQKKQAEEFRKRMESFRNRGRGGRGGQPGGGQPRGGARPGGGNAPA